MKAATCEQIRELDRRASKDYSIPSILLMENAGRAAAHHILDRLPSDNRSPVVILCGKGNNGGDGFVVARHLFNRGLEIRPLLVGSRDDIPPTSDSGINLSILDSLGLSPHPIQSIDELENFRPDFLDASLLVDALLGTGLSRPVRGLYAQCIDMLNASGRPITALDTPSGLNADTGEVLGTAIRADSTVTFALPKIGFFLLEGPAHTGELDVAEISIPLPLIQDFIQ
ncbi:MAG: NAD(P)H-hydrate epimerase [Planctomycetota bacterium]|jgi:NAD(P)H-hydrate epimerase|nr:NAD(P)H-hydrate epimerase [Planctomycetota bacterium]